MSFKINIEENMPDWGFERVSGNSWRCKENIDTDNFAVHFVRQGRIKLLVDGKPADLRNISQFTPKGYVSADRDQDSNFIVVDGIISETHHEAEVRFIVEPN